MWAAKDNIQKEETLNKMLSNIACRPVWKYLGPFLNFLSVLIKNTLINSKWGEEGVYLANNPRLPTVLVGKSQQQDIVTADSGIFTVRSRGKWVDPCACLPAVSKLPFFIRFRTQPMETCWPSSLRTPISVNS